MYDIKVQVLIKTMGKEYTHSQMEKLISDALWSCLEFRDVDIVKYEGNTLPNAPIRPFSNISMINVFDELTKQD